MDAKVPIKDQVVLEYVQDCWRRYQDVTTEIRTGWEELWQAYQSKQDYSKKQSWQSQICIPRIWMLVERASAEIRRAVMNTDQLFSVELDDIDERAKIAQAQAEIQSIPSQQEKMLLDRLDGLAQQEDLGPLRQTYAKAASELRRAIGNRLARASVRLTEALDALRPQEAIRGQIETAFRSAIAKSNLAAVYSDVLKTAMLLGVGVIKCGWDRARKVPLHRAVSPENFAVDPDWDATADEVPEWCIETTYVKLPRLMAIAKEANEAGKIYDVAKIKQLQADYAEFEIGQEARRKGITEQMYKAGSVKLTHFWGYVPDPNVKTSFAASGKMVYAIIANDNYLIRLTANPFAHGRPPYVLVVPLRYPGRSFCGTSLAACGLKLAYAYNNLFNLMLDNLNLTVNKMYQCSPSDLSDPKQLTSVYPGKIWRLRPGVDSSKPIIQEVPTGQLGIDGFRALEFIHNDIQEVTGITEFIQGLPGRQVKTLGEIQLKTLESRGLFDIIARELEQHSIRNILEMDYDMCSQFLGLPPRAKNLKINVSGLTVAMAKQEQLQGIMAVFGMVGRLPDLAAKTDLSLLWRKLLAIYGLADAFDWKMEAQSPVQPKPQAVDLMQQLGQEDASKLVGALEM